jgi:hypothetical protein
MTALEQVVFGVALFSALAALMQWKVRRSLRAARMSQRLREYMATEGTDESAEPLSTALGRG